MSQKAILNISNYSGGLNNHTNARDIEQNQFQDIDSFSIETPGKLKVMGATKEEGTTLTISGSDFTPSIGNGLFYFKSDKDPDQTTDAVDNTEMLLVNDKTDHEIKIYDKTDSAYSSKSIDYGPNASDVAYSAIDGDIRATATDLSLNTSTPKVFTYLNEKCDYGNSYSGTNFPRVDRIGWYEDEAYVKTPTTNEIDLLHFNNNELATFPETEDSGQTTSGSTGTGNSFNVSDSSYFTDGGRIKIGNEIIGVTDKSGNTLSVTRGLFGTTPTDHATGTAIKYVNRTPINKEIIRLPYDKATHTNGYGPLYVNFWLGNENRTTGTVETGNGTWIASASDKLNLFVQFEYLDGQLSPTKFHSSIRPLTATNMRLYFRCFGHIPNITRLKSIHISYNITNDGWAGIETDALSYATAMGKVKYRLLEIDVRKGIRIPGGDDYSAFDKIEEPTTAAQKKYAYPTAYVVDQGANDLAYYSEYGSLTLSTFQDRLESEVALELEEDTIMGYTGTGYKTSTIVNRRLYVGNVKYKDPVTGELQRSNDTVFKSNVNAFDTFLYKNRIDVEVNDGDDIIALENLNGRILQFKTKTLYVINVSRDIEFLEATLDYKGVEKDYHIVKGEGFIAWMNRYGVFLYDGEQVRDLLLDNKGQKRLDWNLYYDSENVIGFIPEEKHLVIANNNQKVLVCDMKSLGWMFGSKRFSTNSHTNMVTLDNGKLVWMEKDGSALKLRYFNPDPSNLLAETNTDELKLKTKDFTFGNPSVDKKIISVYLNYKNGDGVVLYGFTDGAEEIIARLDGQNETEFNTLRINMRQAKTEFINPNAFNNVKNFGLRLDGANVSKDFEINDIQVVFREKSVK